MSIKRALISVSDKTGVVEFARGLKGLGMEILSTGGTAKALREGGIEVTDVSEVTGFPEMMDGRVKTLHPAIHGGLLALRSKPEHLEAIAAEAIEPIDLVAVNLYPFRETVAKPGVTLAEAVEQIDIGGPSMVRSAAKNFESVTIIVDPKDYELVLAELVANDGETGQPTRRALALKAFTHTASYDSAISQYLSSQETEAMPNAVALVMTKRQNLRYGENPHQKAAFYRELKVAGPCIAAARQVHGKELSFNNIYDLNAALELVKSFSEPAAAIIKHTNPCGCAVGDSAKEAFIGAREADPVSRFGGIVSLNRPVDAATAAEILVPGSFYEALIAPSFDADALTMIKERSGWGSDIRLLEVGDMAAPVTGSVGWDVKGVGGGFLIQELDRHELTRTDLKTVTDREPTEAEVADLLFGWKVVQHVKSNAIVFARDCMVVGVGAGQMNRVTSVRLAAEQAGEKAKGAVVASDAFFPMPDGITAAAQAGVTAVIQPGGSKKDADAIAEANRFGLAMVLTGVRHFKH